MRSDFVVSKLIVRYRQVLFRRGEIPSPLIKQQPEMTYVITFQNVFLPRFYKIHSNTDQAKLLHTSRSYLKQQKILERKSLNW